MVAIEPVEGGPAFIIEDGFQDGLPEGISILAVGEDVNGRSRFNLPHSTRFEGAIVSPMPKEISVRLRLQPKAQTPANAWVRGCI